MRSLVYLLFLLSGACGLVYQVVWSRVLTQTFGSTVLAIGAILAAFMSGLALGSFLLGRHADRSENPLRLYAIYEIGIGVTGLVATLLMGQVDSVYLGLHSLLGQHVLLLNVARFLVAFGLVIVPTTLMGATLPILSRFVITQLATVGTSLSTLYTVNTAGAVLGSLLAGFQLIRTLGIHQSVYVAVVCNLAIGLVAWAASRRGETSSSANEGADLQEAECIGVDVESEPSRQHRLLLWAFGLSGFTSFAYEIFWTRSLVHLLGNSTYAFTMMLTAFLTGIALGGYLIRFLIGRVSNRLRLFGWIQLLIGLTAAGAMPLLFSIVESEPYRQFLLHMAERLGPMMFSQFITALLVMLVPATLIGATFPLAGSIYVDDLSRTGADVGRLYAVNTLGNVLGALAPGFLLLPVYGIQKGVVLMAALNLTIGLFILLQASGARGKLRFALPVVFLVVATGLAGAEFGFQFPSEYQTPEDEVLYYREGLLGTTKVFADRNTGHKRMSVDGIVIGGTEFTDYKQQILAHFPKLLLTDYASELSIGLGSGILIGESLQHAPLEDLVCLEIEPTVLEGAEYFAVESHHVLQNSGARIVIDDVTSFLRTTDEKFDIVSADEKTADKYASNGFSYSSDYYELLREHLTPGGLVIQWIPNHLPPSQYQMVLKTFANAFPHGSVWYFPAVGKGGPTNTIVVGSLEEIRLDLDRMNRVLATESDSFSGWQKYGIQRGEELLAHYVCDLAAVREATAEARTNSLEFPYYEFYSPIEYAESVNDRTLHSHDFLIALRQANGLRRLTQSLDGTPSPTLEQAFLAEDRFLSGLRFQLLMASHQEIYPHFEAALQTAPWNRNLRAQIVNYPWNRGGNHYLSGDYSAGLYFLRLAAGVFPESGEVRYYHGLALLQNARPGEAMEEMSVAIRLSPRFLSPRRYLAENLFESGDLLGAKEQLAAILEVEPDDPFAREMYDRYFADPPGLE